MLDPSAPHIIILLIVVLLLFGSRRLPGAAKSLGESMHIFKKSVHGLDENGKPMDAAQAASTPAPAVQQAALPPAAAPAPQFTVDHAAQQQELSDLRRQVEELQKQNAVADSGVGNSSQSF